MELDSSVFLDLPLDGTGDPNAAHNNHQLEPQLMTVGRLKCGMWASFALATVFVAGAKFYFDHQVHIFKLNHTWENINRHLHILFTCFFLLNLHLSLFLQNKTKYFYIQLPMNAVFFHVVIIFNPLLPELRKNIFQCNLV